MSHLPWMRVSAIKPYRKNVFGSLIAVTALRLIHASNFAFQLKASTDLKSEIIKPMVTQPNRTDGQEDLQVSNPSKKSSINLESIFVLSVPVTTHKSFIYCHHRPSLLSDKQRSEVQWKIRAENKMVSLAAKGWSKLENSKSSINKKIVSLVRRLLSSIPYDESCLRSFPRKSTMIREINEEHQASFPRAVLTSDIEKNTVSVDQLKPIPVYHPRFQEPQAILNQMNEFRSTLTQYHKKWAILCFLGIPVSLPLALVPVMPNVPGFYFAYRLYCHLQALRGARNLGYLLESNSKDESIEDTTHLTFSSVPVLDAPYLANCSFEKIKSENLKESERLLINAEIIDELVEITGLHLVKDDLLRALNQESRRLKRELEASQE